MCVLSFVIFPIICLPRPRDHGHYHAPSEAVALLLVCCLAGIGHWRRPSYPLPTTCAVAPAVVHRHVMPLCRRSSPCSCSSILAAAACSSRRPGCVAISPCHLGDLLTPSWPSPILHILSLLPPVLPTPSRRPGGIDLPKLSRDWYCHTKVAQPARRQQGRASTCPTIAADHGWHQT